MGLNEGLFATIETVHRAGLEPDRWPAALESMMNLTGSRAATLEVYDRRTLGHRAFHGWNLQPGTRAEYLSWDGPPNMRVTHAMSRATGDIFYDACLFDDAAIDRDPFYAAFLAPHDVRYFLSGIVERTGTAQTVLTVQRTRRQGHVGETEIAIMPLLLSHVRLAIEASRRIEGAMGQARSFAEALGWMRDGAAILTADGRALFVNDAFAEIARAGDGVQLKDGRLVFATAADAQSLAGGLSRAGRLGARETVAAPADFVVARPSGASPYTASLRPLFGDEREGSEGAVAVLFLRDPARMEAAGNVFGLTPAEMALAGALRVGLSPVDYARQRGLSINTVYTHLRRLKDKVGAGRMVDLVHRLNEARTAARPA